jgi:hypothetical protein
MQGRKISYRPSCRTILAQAGAEQRVLRLLSTSKLPLHKSFWGLSMPHRRRLASCFQLAASSPCFLLQPRPAIFRSRRKARWQREDGETLTLTDGTTRRRRRASTPRRLAVRSSALGAGSNGGTAHDPRHPCPADRDLARRRSCDAADSGDAAARGNSGLTSKCLGPARAGPNASRVGQLVLSRAGTRLGFGRHLVVARRLGKHVVNLGDGACLIHALNRRNLPGHSV